MLSKLSGAYIWHLANIGREEKEIEVVPIPAPVTQPIVPATPVEEPATPVKEPVPA